MATSLRIPLHTLFRVLNQQVDRQTFSWLFVSILAIALGRGNLHPAMAAHAARTPALSHVLAMLMAIFAGLGWSYVSVFGQSANLTAEQQHLIFNHNEHLFQAGQLLQGYGLDVQNFAINSWHAHGQLMIASQPDGWLAFTNSSVAFESTPQVCNARQV